jgi:hypothetical protein
MTRKRLALRFVAVTGALVLVAAIGFASIRPSNTREWTLEHSRLPTITFEGSEVFIEDVRDFRNVTPDSLVAGWSDRTYDLDGIESLWFILSIFHEDDFRGPAHSALSFGFDDGSFVVVSVEARKEVGEGYSIWKGLLKRYELIYVIGDERDLIRSRAVFRPDHVYLYPIGAPREKIRELWVDMLESANALHGRPLFYNTATRNCTTVLRDHVNIVAPGSLPHSWKILLPGYADELLDRLGLLADSGLPIEELRQRHRINEKARAASDAEDFPARIRER